MAFSPRTSSSGTSVCFTRHFLSHVVYENPFLVAKDIIALPKSVTPSRIASNVNGPVAALAKLQPADIEVLDGLAAAGKQKRFIMPPWRTWSIALSISCADLRFCL
jgi:glycerol 2-dehydrogenase (NADP+)